MALYLDNHRSLKSLLDEEKVFPFFRDHPLFVNNHDLPPTGYYRGPQRDPTFTPRALVHAGHYVEPPPVNTALVHNVWSLGADEIEADLALFYDIEDVAPPVPTAPPPPANNSHAYQRPYPPHHLEQPPNGATFSPSGPAPHPAFPRPAFQPYTTNIPPPLLATAAPYAMPASEVQPFAPHLQMQTRPPPAATQFIPAPHSAPSRPPPSFSQAAQGPASSVPGPQQRARPASPPRAVKLDSKQSATPSSAVASGPARSQFAPGINAIPKARTPRSPPRTQQPKPSLPSMSPRQHQPAGHPMGADAPVVGQYRVGAQTSNFAPSVSNRSGAPQPASTTVLSTQASRSLPSLAAPVWPAYNTEPSPFRPSVQAPPPPQQSFKPATAAPATNPPKSGVWAPAPPVMPAPPQNNGVLKSWLPPARPPSHSSAPLPPIRQTLFPTSFPTGGLPPVAKHLSPPPPPAPMSLAGTADRIAAPARSPQQARPAFPSMQKHDPLPLPSWLRPNGTQDARSAAIAPGSLPGPRLPHELRTAAEAIPTLKDGPGFPTGGAAFTGGAGAGAGVRRF